MLCNFHKKSLEKIPDNHESHKIDFENYDYNPYEEDITPSFFDAFKRSSISNSPWESGSKWAKRSTISNSPWESGSKWAKRGVISTDQVQKLLDQYIEGLLQKGTVSKRSQRPQSWSNAGKWDKKFEAPTQKQRNQMYYDLLGKLNTLFDKNVNTSQVDKREVDINDSINTSSILAAKIRALAKVFAKAAEARRNLLLKNSSSGSNATRSSNGKRSTSPFLAAKFGSLQSKLGNYLSMMENTSLKRKKRNDFTGNNSFLNEKRFNGLHDKVHSYVEHIQEMPDVDHSKVDHRYQ